LRIFLPARLSREVLVLFEIKVQISFLKLFGGVVGIDASGAKAP
jgi:hypothetical protein